MPPGVYTLLRRVRIPTSEVSAFPKHSGDDGWVRSFVSDPATVGWVLTHHLSYKRRWPGRSDGSRPILRLRATRYVTELGSYGFWFFSQEPCLLSPGLWHVRIPLAKICTFPKYGDNGGCDGQFISDPIDRHLQPPPIRACQSAVCRRKWPMISRTLGNLSFGPHQCGTKIPDCLGPMFFLIVRYEFPNMTAGGWRVVNQ